MKRAKVMFTVYVNMSDEIEDRDVAIELAEESFFGDAYDDVRVEFFEEGI